jgi:Uma2 family endonuclease
MTAVLISTPQASPTPTPLAQLGPPAAVARTAAEWLRSLGDVPLHRILIHPPPGTATADDVIRLSHRENRGVELVNGTLVEKPVALRESVIASRVIRRLGNVVEPANLGLVSGEQGMIRMLMGNIRMPDVAFFRRDDLPGGTLPDEAAPRLAPALAVEVLSPSNTDAEMKIKLREYFENGVKVVWMLDPPTRTVRVHDAPDRFRQLAPDDALDGGDLLPGFSVRVGELFDV